MKKLLLTLTIFLLVSSLFTSPQTEAKTISNTNTAITDQTMINACNKVLAPEYTFDKTKTVLFYMYSTNEGHFLIEPCGKANNNIVFVNDNPLFNYVSQGDKFIGYFDSKYTDDLIDIELVED